MSDAVQRQLDGLSAGFRASTADVAVRVRALGQQRANETLANDLRVSLDQFASTFEQFRRADGRHVHAHGGPAGKLSDVWDGALSRQERAGESWLATTSRPWPPPPPRWSANRPRWCRP